jgi:hypothetical protein
MDNETISKEEIALALAQTAIECNAYKPNNISPEESGAAIASFFNAILENLKV